MVARPASEVLTQAVDPARDRPVFRQISDHLRAVVVSGQLGEGDQLPSESQLSEHYGVTRTTVRRAIDVLKRDGLVEAQHGSGAFVRARPSVRRLTSGRFARERRERSKAGVEAEVDGAGVDGAGSAPSVDRIEVTEERPPADVAGRLGLTSRQRTVVHRRRHLVDGLPVELATSYIPSSIAKDTRIAEPDTGPGGIYALIEDAGHRLDHFAEQIRTRMPAPDEVAALGLAEGVPVFHVVRTAYDTEGQAVEVCDTVMSSDAYVFDYELPAH